MPRLSWLSYEVWANWRDVAATLSFVAATLARAKDDDPDLDSPPGHRQAFRNARVWPDGDGVHINAHGGGVLFHEGTYYWYGEHRAARARDGAVVPSPGVHCYASEDLYNWRDEGLVLHTVGDPASPVARGCTIERPKVIYNRRTKTFVMWFHLELKDRGYGAALTALATARNPTGPFTFQKALRPNAGCWPLDFPERDRTPITVEEQKALGKADFATNVVAGMFLRRDFAGGQMARDMTLFVDDDGTAYHVASAEENQTLNIHELDDTYTEFTGKFARVGPGGHNEAPAIVKHGGCYYMLASGCTGWSPNAARVLVADSIWGPWSRAVNPCRGFNPMTRMGAHKTFGGQSTYILPVQDRPGAHIAMFDVWRPDDLVTSGYVWLPIRFQGDALRIDWRDSWDLGAFDR
jgi:Glycosyl hydrolases family 43